MINLILGIQSIFQAFLIQIIEINQYHPNNEVLPNNGYTLGQYKFLTNIRLIALVVD